MSQKAFRESKEVAEALFDRFFADWKHLSREEFLDFVYSKAEQILTKEEFEKRILQKKELVVKFGIDPTGPDVHMGHMLPILLLRQFQKAGHKIRLIIGDFTAMIGDPSGRDTQRNALTAQTVKQNLKTYLSQIGRYFEYKKAKVYRNSSWLKRLKLEEILADFQKISLTEILQRDDFRKRIEAGVGISMAELIYSYAQGMDSVELEPDVEVGGRDQYLNFAHARTIMKVHKQEPEVGVVTPVLEGTTGDGRKMSKTYNNYIAVTASLEDKFGKIMSIPDNLILPYFKAFADIKLSETDELQKIIHGDPLEAKKQLAQFLVAIEAKDLAAGVTEREKFESKFSKHTYKEIPEFTAPHDQTCMDIVITLLPQLSKSELKRLFNEQAIRIVEPEERILKSDDLIPRGSVLKVGKKWFFRIK